VPVIISVRFNAYDINVIRSFFVSNLSEAHSLLKEKNLIYVLQSYKCALFFPLIYIISKKKKKKIKTLIFRTLISLDFFHFAMSYYCIPLVLTARLLHGRNVLRSLFFPFIFQSKKLT